MPTAVGGEWPEHLGAHWGHAWCCFAALPQSPARVASQEEGLGLPTQHGGACAREGPHLWHKPMPQGAAGRLPKARWRHARSWCQRRPPQCWGRRIK